MSITSEDEREHAAPLFDGPSSGSPSPPSASDSEGSGSGTDDDDDGEEELDFRPLPPQHFAPPFYGRPPTPLPPSPSLTSLLRPSRPTTPDATDDEHSEPPLPRASPQVPTYEYYGFVLYLFSSLTFLIYLLWSYLPSAALHALGIYYYPNRWWSLAIPSFLVMSVVFVFVALAGYNTEILTVELRRVETIVDEAACVAVVDAQGRIRPLAGKSGARGTGSGRRKREERARGKSVRESREREKDKVPDWFTAERGGWKKVWSEGTDAVLDVPLAGVCEVLYGDRRDPEGEEDELVYL